MELLTAAFVFLLAAPADAGVPPRPLPEHCRVHVQEEGGGGVPDPGRRWNAAYRDGFQAIASGDYATAEREMCRALGAARAFGPRDWRFAETLDELGLIAFQFGELHLAERLQGAAVAEMLLAVGPGGVPPDRPHGPGAAASRPGCASSVPVYLERLGWVLEALPGARSVDDLLRSPWEVFREGYLPLDAALSERLEWLISRYLLEENLAAADALTRLQREIAGE